MPVKDLREVEVGLGRVSAAESDRPEPKSDSCDIPPRSAFGPAGGCITEILLCASIGILSACLAMERLADRGSRGGCGIDVGSDGGGGDPVGWTWTGTAIEPNAGTCGGGGGDDAVDARGATDSGRSFGHLALDKAGSEDAIAFRV